MQDLLSQWEPIIQEKARKYGVHPDLVRAVIWQESRGNPKATSPANAGGLMQIMPGTAKDLGVKNVYDPVQNIDGGTRYLKSLVDQFGLTGGVAAYNAGPGNVQKYKGVPPFKETQGYVKNVLGKFSETFNPQDPGFPPPLPALNPKPAVPQKSFLGAGDNLLGDSKEAPKTPEQKLSFLSKQLQEGNGQTPAAGTSWLSPELLKNLEKNSDSFVAHQDNQQEQNYLNFGKPKVAIPWDTRGENLASPIPRDDRGYKAKTWGRPQGTAGWDQMVEDLNTPLLPRVVSDGLTEILTRSFPLTAAYRLFAESPWTSQDSPYRKVSEGMTNSISNTISGLTSPKSLAVGASLATPAGPYVLAGMTPGMAKDTYEVGKQGVEAAKAGDYKQAAENLTSALTSGAMTYMGAKGAYRGIKADVAPLVEPYIPAIKEIFAPNKSVDFSSNLGGPLQNIFEGIKRAKEKGLFNPKEAGATPFVQTPIPEGVQTLELQMNALKEGKSKAVLATPGADLPTIPKGFEKLETKVGTFIYDPNQIKPYQISKGVEQGNYGQLLGYLEPKSPKTTEVVTATQGGVEAKSALASKENVPLQAAELQRQFPQAKIRTGGADLAAEVLKQRGKDVVGEQIYQLANSEFKPYQKQTVDISPAHSHAVAELKRATGMDARGYVHQVDNYGLKHALEKHQNDPTPLTPEDFKLIPEILSNPDNISYVKNTKGGMPALTYEKTFNDTVYYVEEARSGRKTLSLKTMYKNKTPAATSYAAGSGEASALRASRPPQEVPIAASVEGQPRLASAVEASAPSENFQGLKERGLTQTIRESPKTPEPVAQGVEGSYNPISNRETMARAQEIVKADPIKARDQVLSTKEPTAETNAMAMELMRHFNEQGDYATSINIANHTAKQATAQGQAIQAWAMYDKLGPEGLQRLASKVVNDARENLPPAKKAQLENKAEELAKKDGNQFPVETYLDRAAKELNQPHLDPAFVDSIRSRAAQLQELPEGSHARAEATALILRDISELVPSSLGRKVATLQTIAQLANPKTIIRNVAGNLAFNLAENVKDMVAAPLDKVTSLFTGERTKVLGGGQLSAQVRGFASGLVEGAREAWKGIDLKNVADKWEINAPSQGLPRGRTFTGKVLGNVERVMNVTLRAPDRAFYQAAFDKSIAEQMAIAKVSKPTPEMLAQANFEGLYKTFQDESVAARIFSGIKKSLNLGKEFGAGDILLKYPKTPGNILARSLDYSPVGFVKGALELGKAAIGRGFDQKSFVNSTSRALVGGAGLTYLGYKLSEMGLLRNTEDSKEGVRNLERSVGLNQSQLNVTGLLRYIGSGFDKSAARMRPNDNMVTYDWAVPVSIPVSMGARAQERSKQLASKEGAPLDYLALASSGFEGGVETLGEQPLIKAFTQLGQNRDFSKAVMKSVEGIPGSFTPTLFKQIAQYTDNTRRDTKGSNPFETAKNLVVSKIPFASQTLPAQVDAFGRPVEAYQGGSNSFFNTFLNPAFNSQFKPTPEATIAYNLYKSTGRTEVLPKVFENKETFHGVSLELSAKDRNELQKQMGSQAKTFLSNFAQSPQFQNAPDVLKANLVSKVLAGLKDQALTQYFRNLVNSKPKEERQDFIKNLIQKNNLNPKQAVELFQTLAQ